MQCIFDLLDYYTIPLHRLLHALMSHLLGLWIALHDKEAQKYMISGKKRNTDLLNSMMPQNGVSAAVISN